MRFCSSYKIIYKELLLVVICYLFCLVCYGQDQTENFLSQAGYVLYIHTAQIDTLPKGDFELKRKDTSKIIPAGLAGAVKNKYFMQRDSSFFSLKGRLKKIPQDSTAKNLFKDPFKDIVVKRPWLKLADAYVSYQFNYRSNIDTPFAESNIQQHGIFAKSDFIVGGLVPISVSYWGRQSNSTIFRDINDVQVNFDAAQFGAGLRAKVTERLSSLSPQIIDSLTGRLLQARLLRRAEIDPMVNGSGALQHYIEAHEVLMVPRITYDASLPDSINELREDSIKKMAKSSIEIYNALQKEYKKINEDIDSLQIRYDASLVKLKRFRQLLAGGWSDYASLSDYENKLKEFGLSKYSLPRKYRWLLGVRKFSIGRSNLDQSELTTKNLRINGLNFEYNSWYYFALTAGIIDYRFRDFVVNPVKKSPQYLTMVRVGIGRISGNHLIVSGFKGQKQLFTGSTARRGLSSINIVGYSVEGRIRLNKYTYLTAELAESSSPDFRNNPAQAKTKIGSSDQSNNAYTVHLYSYLPQFDSRFEGMYKYAGGNFQSFNSFQTNAQQKAWYLKFDQGFFRKQIRISAAVRSADFFNPFIIQQYSNNSVFKSITAILRKRKWPVVTLGYIPISQLTKLDNRIFENRFQTLNASSFYNYKIYKSQATSSLVYNRFFNTSSDSGFAYYNAVNLFASQQFYFSSFSTGITASYTKNSIFKLTVIEENMNWNFGTWGTLGAGVKLNKFGKNELKIGTYINGSIRVLKNDRLSFIGERGFLPGARGGLLRNEMVSLQFSKAIRF